MTSPTIVSGEPGGLATLLRTALPSVPGLNLLPGVRQDPSADPTALVLQRPGVTVDGGHVRAYARVCGFEDRETVPLTYPHVLAFPLHLAIMGHPAFPYPAMGSVHVDNAITSHRPLRKGETVGVTARVSEPRPHRKGMAVDFVSEVTAGDELVWESTSTYLRRGRGHDDAAPGLTFEATPPGTVDWRLPGDLGRRYAAVSGDRNPIHLYALTAKALRFPRQIAHGMWSLARCVAAIDNRLPDAVRVEATFKKPIVLPGTVSFGLEPLSDGRQPDLAFALTSPRDGSPHVVGRTTAL